MPPKIKITKEDIINVAVDIVRKDGAQAINARTIASVLGCSTQPIFSNFANMDELRLAVIKKADEICNVYIQREVNSEKYPEYKASGMAYIQFANDEKELFKLLYMRNRTNEKIYESGEVDNTMEYIVQKNIGLSNDEIKIFHLEMWAYVHGIASMIATQFADPDWELISRMLTDAYQGLRKQYGVK